MKPHELQKKIHQLHIVIYAVIFIIISLIAVHYNLSAGNTIIDVAIIGLIAGIISYELAYYYGNNNATKKKRKR
jgi:heme O synthase-like polyprenyltransferase